MTAHISDLASFGWNIFFASQIEGDLHALRPVRVMEVHRSRIRVAGPDIDQQIPRFSCELEGEKTVATVGDWLLLDAETFRPQKMLKRKSLFKRLAPGKGRRVQLIAANIDTLFIVSSCNQEFSPKRLERYLAMAQEADVTPVLVLTKADLADAPEEFATAATKLLSNLVVEIVDARNPDSVAHLSKWCEPGQTVALVGSSGVGKSTLINTLIGFDHIATQGIREDDGKGRHTTSSRTLHHLPTGGWLLDTPGMRELQITDVEEGIKDVFSDIIELSLSCRFNDCKHMSEPGCMVQAALKAGDLDPERLNNWRKLVAEETQNNTSLSQRRTRNQPPIDTSRRFKHEE